MTIKDILIKFQEYQLEFNVLNANCAHNATANMFMERYGVKNCSIADVNAELPKLYTEKDMLMFAVEFRGYTDNPTPYEALELWKRWREIDWEGLNDPIDFGN